ASRPWRANTPLSRRGLRRASGPTGRAPLGLALRELALQALADEDRERAAAQGTSPGGLPTRGRVFAGLHVLLEVAQILAQQEAWLTSAQAVERARKGARFFRKFEAQAHLGAAARGRRPEAHQR